MRPVDQHAKILDKELHDDLNKAGCKVASELSPGSGEVGLLSFVYDRAASGTLLDVGCSQLIIEGKVRSSRVKTSVVSIRKVQGIVFKDGSKLLADVIVDELSPPQVWGINAEGELSQVYQRFGHPGLWFAIGMFAYARFLSKHSGLQILSQEAGIA